MHHWSSRFTRPHGPSTPHALVGRPRAARASPVNRGSTAPYVLQPPGWPLGPAGTLYEGALGITAARCHSKPKAKKGNIPLVQGSALS